MKARSAACAILVALASSAASAREPLKVVTTLPSYASIAEVVGGDRVEARSISRGDEDAHFVKPKPSFALMLRDADLFVTTGLDLELWAPILVDKSGNRRIRQGQPGRVSASAGISLRDVPDSVSRAAGDVHIHGNPHVFTSPLEAKIVAANIAAGLERVDPSAGGAYGAGLEAFERRIDEAMYGRELVDLLGAEALDPLARSGGLIAFLESQTHDGQPLIARLGGWLGRARDLRGRKILAYHKNWIYLTDLFGLEVVDYIEPKPGIPPSAKHVHRLVERARGEEIEVLLAASYFGPSKIRTIAERTGCRAVIVPMGPGGEGPPDYFALIDVWIDGLIHAFED
jgi:ABC-type Zn uptake system ZnuABC Zn-binding protein ZnuA